jgi:hypothetical protein
MFLTYSQTLNGYEGLSYLNDDGLWPFRSVRLYAPSGPSFGKQNWCCGMNQTHC